MLKCKNCGKKFTPHKGNQKHCNPKCQEAFHRKFNERMPLDQRGSITMANGLEVCNDAMGKELSRRH